MVSENILNSNNFQVFLDSLMSSDNNGLSVFLANQVKDDAGDINSGAPKTKRSKKKQITGSITRHNNNVLYVPSIHNGDNNMGVVIGSVDPNESSAYKNMLRYDILKALDTDFSKLTLENKIPIINSGNILSYIEVIDNGCTDNIIEEGAVAKKKKDIKKPRSKSSVRVKQFSPILSGSENYEDSTELENGRPSQQRRPKKM